MSNIQQRVLKELSYLRPNTSACPGAVAKKLGKTLREIRPMLEKMAAGGTIVVTQKGKPVDLGTAKGPVRIRPL